MARQSPPICTPSKELLRVGPHFFFHFITMPIKYYIFSASTLAHTLLLAYGISLQKCNAAKSVDIYICPSRSSLFPLPPFLTSALLAWTSVAPSRIWPHQNFLWTVIACSKKKNTHSIYGVYIKSSFHMEANALVIISCSVNSCKKKSQFNKSLDIDIAYYQCTLHLCSG